MGTIIFKSENEHLSDDNCFLSTLINVSENMFIEKNLLVLERHNDVIKIDFQDIFLNNFIRVSTLDSNVEKLYFAESCDDLKPLIKVISWKDTRFLITEEPKIKNVLTRMVLDLDKATFLESYVNDYEGIYNIVNPDVWAIKIQDNEKGFGIYNGNVVFFNVEQFNNQGLKEDVKELIRIIGNKLNE